jgi:chemotaxis protein CheC
MPRVHVLPVTQISSILENPASLVVCVKMDMLGDVIGTMFFMVPNECREALIRIVEKALLGLNKKPWEKTEEGDLSVVIEIGNILGGVYLSAIYNFCGLNIYHTVPLVAIDMLQSLIDEELAKTSQQIRTAFVIENKFSIIVESTLVLEGQQIRTSLVIVPSSKSTKSLFEALGQAKKAYGSA